MMMVRKCKEGVREFESWLVLCDCGCYEGLLVLDRFNVGIIIIG